MFWPIFLSYNFAMSLRDAVSVAVSGDQHLLQIPEGAEEDAPWNDATSCSDMELEGSCRIGSNSRHCLGRR